jgi:putative FmdB family regulatory protein
MPTYEYACTECGEQLEVVQSFSDDPLTVCPVCEGKLRKLFSAVGVVFKGSGFYKTDSRGGKRKAVAAANGSGEASKSADGSSTSSSGSESAGADSSNGSKTSDSGSGSSSGASTSSAGSSSSSSDSTGGGSKVA